MSNAVKYSTGIRIIVDEHLPLREMMEQIRAMVQQLEGGPEALEKLKTIVSSFIQQIEVHSAAEDEILSPLLSKYLGADAPPIANNAAQHEEARRLLKQYQEGFNASDIEDKAWISMISESLLGAVKVLTEHFDFEEANLFPLCERTLSDEDKAELFAKLKAR